MSWDLCEPTLRRKNRRMGHPHCIGRSNVGHPEKKTAELETLQKPGDRRDVPATMKPEKLAKNERRASHCLTTGP